MNKNLSIEICWSDPVNFKLVFETFARACDALERVKYLQSLGIETKKTRKGKTYLIKELIT